MESLNNPPTHAITDMDEEDLIKLVELADSFSKISEVERRKLPFHINIIDELHANENAHTRILLRLLEYKPDGEFAFLKSFVELIRRHCDSFNPEIHKPRIKCFEGYIDGLIEEKGKYAIIIENKIHWAIDQDKQIESYVNKVIESGTPEANICVIYLTSDGRKVVGGNSLTKDTKALLGERFVVMNYRENILPWLRDELIPNCKIKEDWLTSAISQYVDHLEGMFRMRGIEKNMQKNLNDYLLGQLDLASHDHQKNLNQIDIVQRKIDKVSNAIESVRLSIRDQIWNEVFISQLKEIEQELEFGVEYLKYSTGKVGSEKYQGFTFKPKNWGRAKIKFEFQEKGYQELIVGACKIVKDSPPYDDTQIRGVLTNICGRLTDTNQGWFCWKYLDGKLRSWNNGVFEKILNRELKEQIKGIVKDFVAKCEGLNM